MKRILATTALLLSLSGAAFAQTATGTGTADASSGSFSNSESLASAQTGNSTSAVYIDQRGPVKSTVRTDGVLRTEQGGTVTNKFAPAVAAPAMGSGHPCGLGNSLGISIIGGGVTGGATRVDDACLLAQMGYTPAAMQMIAARNPSACQALVATGQISDRSYCGDARGTPPVGKPGVKDNPAIAPAAASTAPVCMVKPGTTRTIITNAATQQAKMACAASLGVRG